MDNPRSSRGQNRRSGALSFDAFGEALTHFGEEIEQWVRATIQEYVTLIWTGIIEKTPVDTGRARANWQIAVDNDANTTSIPGPPWPNNVRAGIAVIKNMKAFGRVSIYNNVSYIQNLEDGWSAQAPVGMVAVTVAEVNASFGGGDALDHAVSLDDLINEQREDDGGSRRRRGGPRTRGGDYL